MENSIWLEHPKLSEAKVIEIKRMLFYGMSCQKIADKFDVSKSTIKQIRSNNIWNHITNLEV